MKCFAIVLVCFWLSVTAHGQDGAVEGWKTTDGKSVDAIYQSLDVETGDVTVLVPRTVALERLDAQSRAKVMKLAGNQFPKPIVTVKEWRDAEPSRKLVVAKKWVFALLVGKALPDPLLSKLETVEDIDEVAKILIKHCDDLTEEGAGAEDNSQVSEIVAVFTTIWKQSSGVDSPRVFIPTTDAHSPSVSTWKTYSDRQKQVVSGNLLLLTITNGIASEKLLGLSQNLQNLNGLIDTMTKRIDEIVMQGGDANDAKKVYEIFASIAEKSELLKLPK